MSDVPQMRRNQTIFVLDFKRRIKEAVHELEQLLVVIEKSPTIDVVEVEVEESLVLAALKQFVEFFGFLGEEGGKVNRLHGVDGDLLSVPLDPAERFVGGSHDVCWLFQNGLLMWLLLI